MQSKSNIMEIANSLALQNSKNNYKDGGPFGAVIVDKKGKIISKAKNMVICKHDPTAHAEINAIRTACKKLKTHDLTGFVLYTSCYPCPMCLSAIIWSNIKTVYYGNTKEDADKIGFRDDKIYDYLKLQDSTIELKNINREITINSFNDFESNTKKILY